jgi:hypothetical protein
MCSIGFCKRRDTCCWIKPAPPRAWAALRTNQWKREGVIAAAHLHHHQGRHRYRNRPKSRDQRWRIRARAYRRVDASTGEVTLPFLLLSHPLPDSVYILCCTSPYLHAHLLSVPLASCTHILVARVWQFHNVCVPVIYKSVSSNFAAAIGNSHIFIEFSDLQEEFIQTEKEKQKRRIKQSMNEK